MHSDTLDSDLAETANILSLPYVNIRNIQSSNEINNNKKENNWLCQK